MNRRLGKRAMQRGFSLILALFLLVSLAGIGAFLLTISSLQQESITADEMGARAYQAARACIETAAYQALRPPLTCTGLPQTLTFTTGSLNGFYCTVTCTAATAVPEGSSSTIIYRIVADGCNQTPCPAPAGAVTPTYVNRELQLTLTN